jgi:hypothetical protein
MTFYIIGRGGGFLQHVAPAGPGAERCPDIRLGMAYTCRVAVKREALTSFAIGLFIVICAVKKI